MLEKDKSSKFNSSVLCTKFLDTGPCVNGSIRLAGGSNLIEGRIEVCYDGDWGTVCDDNFDSSDALVACRQLGYNGTGKYVQITTNITLYDYYVNKRYWNCILWTWKWSYRFRRVIMQLIRDVTV